MSTDRIDAFLSSTNDVLSMIETKDKVRTPEGAEKYGEPIGATIVKDAPHAYAGGFALDATAPGPMRVFTGPRGSRVEVYGEDITDDELDLQFSTLGNLLKIAPIDDVMVVIGDEEFISRDFGEGTMGFTIPGTTRIYLRTDAIREGKGVADNGVTMPTLKSGTGPREYSLIHEWGHLLDRRDKAARSDDWGDVFSKHQRYMSRYAYEDGQGYEAFAEAFVGWFGSQGWLAREDGMVKFFADKYGWDSGPGRAPHAAPTDAKAAKRFAIVETFDKRGALHVDIDQETKDGRHVRDVAFWGAPVGTPLPLAKPSAVPAARPTARPKGMPQLTRDMVLNDTVLDNGLPKRHRFRGNIYYRGMDEFTAPNGMKVLISRKDEGTLIYDGEYFSIDLYASEPVAGEGNDRGRQSIGHISYEVKDGKASVFRMHVARGFSGQGYDSILVQALIERMGGADNVTSEKGRQSSLKQRVELGSWDRVATRAGIDGREKVVPTPEEAEYASHVFATGTHVSLAGDRPGEFAPWVHLGDPASAAARLGQAQLQGNPFAPTFLTEDPLDADTQEKMRHLILHDKPLAPAWFTVDVIDEPMNKPYEALPDLFANFLTSERSRPTAPHLAREMGWNGDPRDIRGDGAVMMPATQEEWITSAEKRVARAMSMVDKDSKARKYAPRMKAVWERIKANGYVVGPLWYDNSGEDDDSNGGPEEDSGGSSGRSGVRHTPSLVAPSQSVVSEQIKAPVSAPMGLYGNGGIWDVLEPQRRVPSQAEIDAAMAPLHEEALRRAQEWQAARDKGESKHLPGLHDQSTHGRRGVTDVLDSAVDAVTAGADGKGEYTDVIEEEADYVRTIRRSYADGHTSIIFESLPHITPDHPLTPRNLSNRPTRSYTASDGKVWQDWADLNAVGPDENNNAIEMAAGLAFQTVRPEQQGKVMRTEDELDAYITDVLERAGYKDRIVSLHVGDDMLPKEVEAAISRGMTQTMPEDHDLYNADVPVFIWRKKKGVSQYVALHEIAHIIEGSWKDGHSGGHNEAWYDTWFMLMENEGESMMAARNLTQAMAYSPRSNGAFK